MNFFIHYSSSLSPSCSLVVGLWPCAGCRADPGNISVATDRSRCDSGCRAFGRSTHRHGDGDMAGQRISCGKVGRGRLTHTCMQKQHIHIEKTHTHAHTTNTHINKHTYTPKKDMHTHAGTHIHPKGTASAQHVSSQAGMWRGQRDTNQAVKSAVK